MNRAKSRTKPGLTFIVLGLLNVLLWSPPALAAGAENFKQFEAEVSDEFKAAGPRIC
jgi:hypothetical protein